MTHPDQERQARALHDSIPATDGAGVSLRRVLGTPALMQIDPFLLLDEFYSTDPKDYIAGFPAHPHRGFETLTYMIDGRMRHEDNKGGSGLLKAGGAQYMTAGRGIIHSEMPEQEDGLLRGLQLWINLPASHKMTAPSYQDIPAHAMSVFDQGPAQITLVSGTLSGHTGPARGAAQTPLFADLLWRASGPVSLTLPVTHNAFLYGLAGQIDIAGQPLTAGRLAHLSTGRRLNLRGERGSRVVLVAGQPISEPVARYGPFVMTTRQEIIDASRDFQAGRF
tara:strand:- start:3454 stop:4290 length:837 start_codon:yes stop_codon:yes gene_type:complete